MLLPNLYRLSGARTAITIPESSSRDYFPSFEHSQTLDQDEFWNLLFGVETFTKLARIIANGAVLWNHSGDKIVDVIYNVQNVISFQKWWLDLYSSPEKRRIGRGAYNTVFKLYRPEVDEHFPLGLVVRVATNNRVQETVYTTLREFMTASYACKVGVGPVIYSFFYVDKNAPPPSPTAALEDPRQPAQYQNNDHSYDDDDDVHSYTFLEAWDGNVRDIEDRMDETRFAKLFVDIIDRAATRGIFHFDIKSENMLYRNDASGNLVQLVMTDFDPMFCLLKAPHTMTNDQKMCGAIIMTACFLGKIKCNQDSHLQMRLGRAIVQQFMSMGVNLEEKINKLECAFLVKEVYDDKSDDVDDELHSALRRYAKQYLIDQRTQGLRQCLAALPEALALFRTVVQFAFNKQPHDPR
jgi:hypothetical protein